MKKINQIFLSIFLIFFISLTLLFIFKLFEINTKDTYIQEATLKNSNLKIKIIDINDLINDKIEGLIYFGRDTCPVCNKFNEEFLNKELAENNNLIIYEFNTDYWRDNENFQKILNKYNITKIPTLIKITSDTSYNKFELNSETNISNETIQLNLKNFLYN